jgi:transcription-repair coupling factor (superfamily II helicase)
MDKHLEPLLEQIAVSVYNLVKAFKAGSGSCKLGLRRSARLPVAAALQRLLSAPTVLITDRADHALVLAEELELWAPSAMRLLFPEPNPLFYENAAWGDTIRRERLLALTTLASYHIPGAPVPTTPPLIITPARALMTRTLPRRDFLTAARSLKRNQLVQLDDLVRNWVALGYEPVNTVIAPGQFARRGGILDLWPPVEAYPIRIEFFGDEIDTLRCFDPSTQRTLPASSGAGSTMRERILISPAREYLLPIKSNNADPTSPLAYQELAREYSEFHIPAIHSQPACLLDYLPLNSVVFIDDAQILEDVCTEIEEQAIQFRRDAIDHQTLQPEFPIPYLTWSELHDSLERFTTIELGPSRGSEQSGEEAPVINLPQNLAERFSPVPRFGGRLKPLIETIAGHYQDGEQVVVVSRQSARLKELWAEQPRDHDQSLEDQRMIPVFIEGSLSEGWVYRPAHGPVINLLTDGEIFGWRRPKPRYRRSDRYAIAAEDPEANYSDLLIGDFVVHVDHGIGRFTGLVRRSVDNLEREYLRVEYADEAQLFVPVHQVDRLTRYVGSDNHPPGLSRLGSAEWKNVKTHVKEAVQEVAADLLELYARRSIAGGYRFSSDTTWQQELEASFPYIETDDQMRVLVEVKRDMEKPRPMDRLICGDVGYGKTEVALRAAFKAVNDNRQVAVLVPTTVLAQQHYHTFQERLAAFPLKVEMLSRFRTPQQQREIVDQLKAGLIDIIIGTHRMLSSDVEFKDLGLLIIDEEQRFGVTHKEALKKMRSEVDVLTLTATPIPRTLYMALSGVRDISTINTPPEERLPIITHIGPYSPLLVRQAVVRELERGGQVFFVHNRVQTIGAMQKHLEKILPEARIAIAHGQMAENELSQRMEQFTSGEVDILLSTSIIESGLDIPNANTLIVDRADTFGLAQLYQLRGRVGRGAQRAYAYFFRHKRKPPTEEGRQRLDTIAENTQLGAGFSIAMRDLEIRGTGDILGTRQHGHIAAVGFHLYTRLLAEAVRRLRADRGLPDTAELITLQKQLPSVNVELPIPASIPADYVPDKNTRLGLYRRLADLRSQGEVDALIEELADRFGPLPEMVRNLAFQVRIRLFAEKAGLTSITGEANQIVFRFPEGMMPTNLPDLGPNARLGKIAIWMPYMNVADWPVKLVELLEKLTSHTADQVTENLVLDANNHRSG